MLKLVTHFPPELNWNKSPALGVHFTAGQEFQQLATTIGALQSVAYLCFAFLHLSENGSFKRIPNTLTFLQVARKCTPSIQKG